MGLGLGDKPHTDGTKNHRQQLRARTRARRELQRRERQLPFAGPNPGPGTRQALQGLLTDEASFLLTT